MLSETLAQNVRKGVCFFGQNEFTIQFDAGFMRTNRQEYLMMVELVKKLKQQKFDARRNAWDIKVAEDAIRCLHKLVGYGINATTSAREKLAEELKKIAATEGLAQQATEVAVDLIIPGCDKLNAAMKNYQKAGVKFLSTVERGYLADDMGLGKSLQALATLENTKAYPALIVCPVKLKQNWLLECRLWLPHRKTSMLANDLAEITILGYSEIHDYVNFKLASPKAKERKLAEQDKRRYFFPGISVINGIVGDEFHWVKAAESRRTQAMVSITNLCKPRIRIGMSGTPIENGRPKELIAPLTFLDQMESMGGWFNFTERYCGVTKFKVGAKQCRRIDGASNTQELYQRLSKTCFTGETQIAYEHGTIDIATIVRKRLRLRVWSSDKMGNAELRPIVGFSEKSHTGFLVRVVHESGSFTCTGDHLIYTRESGYIRAENLTRECTLSTLQETIHEGNCEQSRISVLHGQVCGNRKVVTPRIKRATNRDSFRETWTGCGESMQALPDTVCGASYHHEHAETILRSSMCRSLSHGYIGNGSSNAESGMHEKGRRYEARKEKSRYWPQAERPEVTTRTHSQHEGFDAGWLDETKIREQGCGVLSREQCQKGAVNDTPGRASHVAVCPRTSRHFDGICSNDGNPQLLGGLSSPTVKNSDRDRWIDTRTKIAEKNGPREGTNICVSRVRYVEILAMGNRGGLDERGQSCEPVYDIEVEGNHNFFANRVLVHNCYIRRIKSDVLKELPPKIQTIYDVELSNWNEYNRIDKDVTSYLIQKKGRLLTDGESNASAMMKLEVLRNVCGVGKVEWIVDWVNTFLESGQKFVLYAAHKEVQAALLKGLAHWDPAVVYAGCDDVSAEVEKFKKKSPLFLGSVLSAGFGINGLQGVASHVGLAELMWTDSKHQQVFDRLHRIGQVDCVNCYYFLARGTIDDPMWDVLSNKAQINASAVDGEDEAKASVLSTLARKTIEP